MQASLLKCDVLKIVVQRHYFDSVSHGHLNGTEFPRDIVVLPASAEYHSNVVLPLSSYRPVCATY